jgi:predicted AAA+ superfamily ATPase
VAIVDWDKVHFERDIYSRLLKWAENSEKALFLRGPRQVGKTTTLLKLGETDNFSGCVYVDLRAPEIRDWWDTAKCHGKWSESFRAYAEAFPLSVVNGEPFSENCKPLIILDEIQESPRMFNSIRDIVNEKHVKLVVTGSYLGIAEFENRFSTAGQPFFMPTGNVDVLEMGTLTYREALRACEQIKIGLAKEEIFKRYFQFGGYPAVVKTWMQTEDKHECVNVLQQIYALIRQEAQRYIAEPLAQATWDRVFLGVAGQIEKKEGNLQEYDQELTYLLRIPSANNAANKLNRISMLHWMLNCDLLVVGEITNNLSKLDSVVKHSYFFADQGLLFLAMTHASLYPSAPIDIGNMSGILAENFVALGLREYMVPLSYSRSGKDPEEIDFIYKKKLDLLPDAIEVKFKDGRTISSERALKDGKVKRIIKIQGNDEDSTDKVIIFPLRDMDEFGVFLGYSATHNRYYQPLLNLFDN